MSRLSVSQATKGKRASLLMDVVILVLILKDTKYGKISFIKQPTLVGIPVVSILDGVYKRPQ